MNVLRVALIRLRHPPINSKSACESFCGQVSRLHFPLKGGRLTQIMNFGAPTPSKSTSAAGPRRRSRLAAKLRTEVAKIPALRDLQYDERSTIEHQHQRGPRARRQLGVTTAGVGVRSWRRLPRAGRGAEYCRSSVASGIRSVQFRNRRSLDPGREHIP